MTTEKTVEELREDLNELVSKFDGFEDDLQTAENCITNLSSDYRDFKDRVASFARNFRTSFDSLTPEENEKRITELLSEAGLELRPKGSADIQS